MPAATPGFLRRLWPILGVLLAIYGLWLVIAWTIQRWVLFPRHLTRPSENAGLGIGGLEKNWLQTEEGQVEWWFVPAAGEVPAQGAPTVFYAHENGGLIDYQTTVSFEYHRRGFHVVHCEFRGYGRSAGSPSQAAITDDFVAVHDLVVERPDVDRERLLYHGRSIGTGVACGLAVRRPPRALVLTSPFTSIASMMARYGIPRPLVRDPFDNLTALRDVARPVLLLHGERDDIVPARHSQILAEELPDAQRVVYQGYGHNDLPVDGRRYWEDIEAFLIEVGLLELDPLETPAGAREKASSGR